MTTSLPLRLLPSRQRGFTLIELLIAVAIVGILVRLAYPVYTKSLMKSRRADAKAALLDLAQREERNMAQYNQYSNSATQLGYGSAFPLKVQSGSASYYTIATPTITTNPAGFSATATPSGAQAGDLCGSYTLTSTGQQTSSGSGGGSDCW